MKIQRVLLTVALVAGWCASLQASHDLGGAITYSCMNACTTRVRFTGYKECSLNGPMPTTFTWTGAPGCVAPNAVGVASSIVYQEITPICPTAVTACTNLSSTLYGVSQYTWHQDYDVCSGTPCAYTISWNTCCRPMPVTNLLAPVGEFVWVQASLHTGITPCNNSPQFLGPPMIEIFEGQNHVLANTASDPDGDSLAFQLGPCLGQNGANVVYAAGYSPIAMMGPTWNVSIDPLTGKLTFQANPGNAVIAVICVYVNEFRNGVLLGQVMRDYMVTVMPNPSTDTDPVLGNPFNVSSNATAAGNHLYACGNAPVCFDITCSDVDVAQTLLLGAIHILPGATFTSVGSTLPVDTIPGTSAVPPTGRFCWTPTVPGIHYVRFVAADGACPFRGVADQVVVIHVSPFDAQATATVGGCPDVQFHSTVCGANAPTYAWSGAGGFSSAAANPNHAYPGPGTYPWQLIVSDGFNSDTILDTVVVPAGPSHQSFLSGIHFVAPCTGTLYDTLDAGTWTSYQWSNGDTTQQTVVYIGGTYGVTVTDPNGCIYHDSTALYWATPDIYGVVETSLGGPLQNQKILLIEHDTTLQALWAVDSTWTDSIGYYFFCNVTDTLVFLKALPSQTDYPYQMPTYADTTLYWNYALAFQPQMQSPFQHDFSTLFGLNMGGPGFIGGLITQGANKTGAVGDPVPGLRVFLRDANTGATLGYRDSDSNGYFSFAGIPLGDYEVVPDRPLVSTTNVPALTLSAQTQVMDSLDFQLHRYWLELVLHPTNLPTAAADFTFQARPNPFGATTRLEFTLVDDAVVTMEIFDVTGRKVADIHSGHLAAGLHRFEVGDRLHSGIYFAKLHVNGNPHLIHILKY